MGTLTSRVEKMYYDRVLNWTTQRGHSWNYKFAETNMTNRWTNRVLKQNIAETSFAELNWHALIQQSSIGPILQSSSRESMQSFIV